MRDQELSCVACKSHFMGEIGEDEFCDRCKSFFVNEKDERIQALESLCEELLKTLELTKKLTMGPSFEYQDSIMCRVLESISKAKNLLGEKK